MEKFGFCIELDPNHAFCRKKAWFVCPIASFSLQKAWIRNPILIQALFFVFMTYKFYASFVALNNFRFAALGVSGSFLGSMLFLRQNPKKIAGLYIQKAFLSGLAVLQSRGLAISPPCSRAVSPRHTAVIPPPIAVRSVSRCRRAWRPRSALPARTDNRDTCRADGTMSRSVSCCPR